MTSEANTTVGRGHTGPQDTPRLWLKRKAPVSGYVDGAWWPHGDDLPTELPDLLKVLSVRLGAIARVLYNIAEWAPAPRRLTGDGQREVRLDGYRRQPPNTIEILGTGGERIVLLVVPAGTEPELAHSIVMAAAAPDDKTSVETLLSGNPSPAPQPV